MLSNKSKSAGLVAVALLAALCLTSVAPAQDPTALLTPAPLGRLQPGLQIGQGAPQGWSNLLWLARPRLGSGDVAKVPSIVANYTGMFSMVCAANIVPQNVNGQQSFRLDKVAIGLSTDIGGRQVVITSATEQKLGANLGVIGSRSLVESEKSLAETYLIAQTPTVAIFDARNVSVLYKGDHHYMTVRNVVLLSAKGGGLATLCWLMGQDEQKNYALAEPQLYFLPPNHREDRIINVMADKFVLGIPTNDAFAVVRIAQGRPLAFSPAVRTLAAAPQFSAQTAHQLELELWKVLIQGNLTSQKQKEGQTSPPR